MNPAHSAFIRSVALETRPREQLHIKRCLEKLAPLDPRQIFIVESQCGDNTHNLAVSTARSFGFQVVSGQSIVVGNDKMSDKLITHNQQITTLYAFWHDWPGLQAAQFNWALDNLPIGSEWVLRLDADEYLTDEGIAWLREHIDSVPSKYNALEFLLERKFCGGLIRHGTNGIPMVRMFRRGTARYGEGLMDERLVFVSGGRGASALPTGGDDGLVLPVPVVFYDDSLMPMSEWRTKHRGYAKREAQQAIESMRSGQWSDPRKAQYYRLPPYFRAIAYFAIRYFLKGGFLDGYAGWMWNFWQGLWYRMLVDREISEMKTKISVTTEHRIRESV